MTPHQYEVQVRWTGNTGSGTSGYREYERSHTIAAPGKSPVEASSDPKFRGDSSRYNPEELLVASLSSCHMLWFLHLCADAGVIVTSYVDTPIGTMTGGTASEPGRFSKAVLRPEVELLNLKDKASLIKLHEEAHRLCFIANSVNFAVEVKVEEN